MKFTRFIGLRILFAILLFAVVGTIAWQIFFPGREQRLLTLVIKDARASRANDIVAREAAAVAIRRFGTNALPVLMAWAGKKKDSAFAIRMRTVPKPLERYSRHLDANEYHAAAHWGFGVLGSAAKPAVPGLIALLNNPDPFIQDSAVLCLGAVGPAAEEAVPALLLLTKDQPAGIPNPNNAVVALGLIHARSETVVPVLIGYLNGSSAKSGQQGWSIQALAQFGPEAKAAIPSLVKLLGHPYDNAFATNALKKIDPEAAAKAGIK